MLPLMGNSQLPKADSCLPALTWPSSWNPSVSPSYQLEPPRGWKLVGSPTEHMSAVRAPQAFLPQLSVPQRPQDPMVGRVETHLFRPRIEYNGVAGR